MTTVEDIEQRFLEISGINCDLSKFPLTPDDIKNNIKVDKEKSDQYGEVFTPLWLVDQMILKAEESLYGARTTLDLCAGYGQFTIRMIRALYNHDQNFDVTEWLKNHTFIELQLESAYKILNIFGTDINLLIGDALEIEKVIKWDEINYFDHYWKPIPKDWINVQIRTEEREFAKNFLNKFKEKESKLLTL